MPSQEPLGLGPTAIAEEKRETDLERQRRAQRLAEQRRAPEPEPEPAPEYEDKTGDDASVASDAGAKDADVDATTDAGATDAATEPAPGAPQFAGEYVGSDVMTIRLAGMPEQTQRDDKAKTRVRQSSKDRIVITIIDSSNNEDLCSFEAEVNGTAAKVLANQDCFGSQNGPMRGSIQSGTLELLDKRLVVDLKATLEASMGGNSIRGSIDYHFEGRRQ